jgi:hypothetical protein
VLAQIAAAQSSNPGAFSSDALTRAILEKLNEEVQKVKAESGSGSSSAEAAAEPVLSPAASTRTGLSGAVRIKPLPVDLWKAAHEVEDSGKQVSQAVMGSCAWWCS